MPLKITRTPVAAAPAVATPAAVTPTVSAGEIFDPRTASFTDPPTSERQMNGGKRYNSGRFLPHIAAMIFGKPLMMRREDLEVRLGVLGPRIGLGPDSNIPILAWDDDYDDDDDDNPDRPYDLQNGLAVVPIHGTLLKRAMGLSALSGLSSYESLQSCLALCMSDPDVKGIVLDCDSPGGSASGMFECADYIYSLRGQGKPISAVINDQMCSAAYALGSCADQIYTTVTGMGGSVGVYMLHVDRSASDKMNGVKFTYVQAGDKKTEGNAHEPLDKSARATMQAEVNRLRDMFVTLVARNRSVTAQQVMDTEAGVKFGPENIPLFADKIGTLADCCTEMRAKLGIEDEDEDDEEKKKKDEEDEEDDDSIFAELSKFKDADLKVVAEEFGLEVRVGSPMFAIRGIFHGQRLRRMLDVLYSRSYAGAIPPHKTATTDVAWDGPANKARLKNDQNAAYYRRAYAWQESGSDGTKKNQFRYVHHMVAQGGAIGAANVQGCRSGIGVLNGARGGTTIPTADRKGVYNHLAKHMRDAGVDPPEFKGESEYLAALSAVNDMRHFGGDLQTLISMARTGWADHEFGEDASYSIFGADPKDETQRVILAYRHSSCINWIIRQPDDTRMLSAPSRCGLDSTNPRQISLLLAPYDGSYADLGSFREVYAPGCFSNGLDSDPRLTFCHKEDCILGRQSADTAQFWEDRDGLKASCNAPETSWANDLLVSMSRGDINQSSAGFYILKHRWEVRDGIKYRVIEQALLREGSVQPFAAYPNTKASVQPAATAQPSAIGTGEPNSYLYQNELDRARLELLKF